MGNSAEYGNIQEIYNRQKRANEQDLAKNRMPLTNAVQINSRIKYFCVRGNID